MTSVLERAEKTVHVYEMMTLSREDCGFFMETWQRCRFAEAGEDTIVVLDALTYAGNRNSLKALETSEKIHFVHGNIRDLPLVERLLRDHRIDTVVHFAAESHVDRY